MHQSYQVSVLRSNLMADYGIIRRVNGLEPLHAISPYFLQECFSLLTLKIVAEAVGNIWTLMRKASLPLLMTEIHITRHKGSAKWSSPRCPTVSGERSWQRGGAMVQRSPHISCNFCHCARRREAGTMGEWGSHRGYLPPVLAHLSFELLRSCFLWG